LTSARANGSLGAEFDPLIDRVSNELDAARSSAAGVRGAARQALLDRLAQLDEALVRQARSSLDEATRGTIAREAEEELAGFRAAMPPDGYTRAREAAIDRIVRERLGLPTVVFGG
jgi:hypothetical protein